MSTPDPFPPHPPKEPQSPDGKKSGEQASITPLDGTVSLDDRVSMESQVLAYRASARIAAAIATETKACCSRVVLLNELLAVDIRNSFGIRAELSVLEKAYRSLVPEKSTVARDLSAAAAVAPAVELLGLFREDTQLSGRKFDITERALHASLAGALVALEVAVSMPALMSTVGGSASPPPTPPWDRAAELFAPVLKARRDAMESLRPQLRRLAELDEELGGAEGASKRDKDRISATRGQIAQIQGQLRPALLLLEKTDAQFVQLQTSLGKVDEKSGLSGYARFVRALEILADSEAAFLFAAVVAAGGTYRVSRNLWRTLFFRAGWSFSGGCIAWYVLFRRGGEILAASTHRHLEPFTSIREPFWARLFGSTSEALNSTSVDNQATGPGRVQRKGAAVMGGAINPAGKVKNDL